MITKQTKGYTKSNIDALAAFTELKKKYESDIFKNPNEPLDQWIIRKTEEQLKQSINNQ